MLQKFFLCELLIKIKKIMAKKLLDYCLVILSANFLLTTTIFIYVCVFVYENKQKCQLLCICSSTDRHLYLIVYLIFLHVIDIFHRVHLTFYELFDSECDSYHFYFNNQHFILESKIKVQ